MPRLGPIKRNDLIAYFRRLGFEGPFSGRKHELMRRGSIVVHIPNPHPADIGVGLLRRILDQAHITRSDWEAL